MERGTGAQSEEKAPATVLFSPTCTNHSAPNLSRRVERSALGSREVADRHLLQGLTEGTLLGQRTPAQGGEGSASSDRSRVDQPGQPGVAGGDGGGREEDERNLQGMGRRERREGRSEDTREAHTLFSKSPHEAIRYASISTATNSSVIHHTVCSASDTIRSISILTSFSSVSGFHWGCVMTRRGVVSV